MRRPWSFLPWRRGRWVRRRRLRRRRRRRRGRFRRRDVLRRRRRLGRLHRSRRRRRRPGHRRRLRWLHLPGRLHMRRLLRSRHGRRLGPNRRTLTRRRGWRRWFRFRFLLPWTLPRRWVGVVGASASVPPGAADDRAAAARDAERGASPASEPDGFPVAAPEAETCARSSDDRSGSPAAEWPASATRIGQAFARQADRFAEGPPSQRGPPARGVSARTRAPGFTDFLHACPFLARHRFQLHHLLDVRLARFGCPNLGQRGQRRHRRVGDLLDRSQHIDVLKIVMLMFRLIVTFSVFLTVMSRMTLSC